MRGSMLIISLVLLSTPAWGYQYWNELRHSALLPDETMTIRVENPAGDGYENSILFAAGGVAEEPMTLIPDGPSTLAATVPGPVAETRYYGFRLLHGDDIDLMPVRIGDDVDPLPQDLTRLASDSSGDELFGYVNLDLVDCRLAFSGTRLYTALQNAGGGFPVNQGLTFFGYLLGIADPAQEEPAIVFALMYTFEQAGIISPGLYKIMGSGLGDLEKIGEVEVEEFPGISTLLMSCDFGDLLADADFSSWYDPADPTIGVAGFTQRITLLGGAAEADRSPGGRCYVRELRVDPGMNELPELSDFYIVGMSGNAFAQIEYWDADGNCPVLSEVVFDETIHLPMHPWTLDYDAPIIYLTDAGEEPLASGNWSFAVARFSDNLTDVVENVIEANDVADHPWSGGRDLQVRVAPNPFSDEVLFTTVEASGGPLRLDVFDASGRRVACIARGESSFGVSGIRWNGLDGEGNPLPGGAYFYRLHSREGERRSSLRLIR
jgi:hypothetical protein